VFNIEGKNDLFLGVFARRRAHKDFPRNGMALSYKGLKEAVNE
jgi:hypothetical protein